MATEQIDGIEFYVDVDTAGAVSSTKVIDNTTKKIESSFKSVDTQVKKSSKAVKKAIDSQATATKAAGRAAQNFSYQIQDVAVQLAGGQQPALIFAQQFPQMAVGMGAAAAGIGALVAVLGGLYLAFGDTTTNMEKFEASVERLKATLTLSAQGVAEYSDQMKRLNLISKQLVETQLRATIAEQEKAFKLGARALREYAQDATSFTRGFSSFADRVKDLTGKDLGEKGFDEARASLVRFTREVTLFSLDPTEDSVRRLSDALVELEKDGASTTEKGRLLISETLKQVQAFNEGKITIKELNKALKDNSEITESTTAKTIEHKKSVKDLVESIEQEALTHNFNARALALYVAVQQGATQEQINSINASYDRIDSLDAETDAIKKRTAAEKKADRDAKNKSKSDSKKLSSNASGVADKFGDPLTVLADQKAKELEILKKAEEQGLQLHSDYALLRANIDTDYAEKERVLREQKYIAESKANELALSSIDALGTATTDTLSGLLSGTYSATEAMQQFANTILNNAVGALVDVGVQYVKNALISEASDKAILASKTATNAANSATHTAAITATVAELSSLAAAGAFASTAAIPIVGPVLAPAAAAAAGAATAGLGATAIASAPVAGARFDGGDVSANKLYEVGEKNRPEMLMIPGNNGKVFSNAEMKNAMSGSGGGEAQLNIKVINLPGQTASVTQQGEGVSRETVIQILSEQSASIGSKINQNINKNHNVTNRQGGNRRN